MQTLFLVCLKSIGSSTSQKYLSDDGIIDVIKIIYVGSFVWNNIQDIIEIDDNHRVMAVCSMMQVKASCMTQLIINSVLLRVVPAYNQYCSLLRNPNVSLKQPGATEDADADADKAYISVRFMQDFETLIKMYEDVRNVSGILDDLRVFSVECGGDYREYNFSPVTNLLVNKILHVSCEECIICKESLSRDVAFYGCDACSCLVCHGCVCKIKKCPCCQKKMT